MKLGRFEICFCWSKGGYAKKWWELSIMFCYRTKKFRDWRKRLRAMKKPWAAEIPPNPDITLPSFKASNDKDFWVEEAAEIPSEEFDKLGK